MKESILVAALAICTTTMFGAAQAQQSSHDARNSANTTNTTSAANQRSPGQDSALTPDLNRASKVLGTDVVDNQGKKIGDIKDIVLDRKNGQIAYAVVSFGGVMGVGSKYFAIPWKSLQANAGENYVLNVDKETLKRAPGFDKNHWPDMASAQWNRDVYRFYNQTPYWEGSSSGTSTGNSNMEGNSSSGSYRSK